jgi:hypothetical protein
MMWSYTDDEPDFDNNEDESGYWWHFNDRYEERVLILTYPTVRRTELALANWPADHLSTEGHAVIATLSASLPQSPNLGEQLTSLTDNKCGDFLMRWIERALAIFEESNAYWEGRRTPEGGYSVLLIAARVAHTLLRRYTPVRAT